jgi:hypothetical protein
MRQDNFEQGDNPDLISQASKWITVALSAFSVRSVLRQISVKTVIASLTFWTRVSGSALAAELTPEVDRTGRSKVPVGRRTLARLARLASHRFSVKSGRAKLAVRSGGVFPAVLKNNLMFCLVFSM